jgi:penicillin amidase
VKEALAPRRIRRGASVIVALVIVAGVLSLVVEGIRGRSAVKAAFPDLEGRLAVAGLERSLRIDRDGRGVAHVSAGSESDAFFGLGFVHAQDRLGQMLWLRRRARGRAAESLGAAALDADIMARTIGFARLAEAQLRELDPDTRRVLDAYAAGVNARIARIEAGQVAPPVLAARARLELESWGAVDSLAVYKLYAWGLSESVEASLVLSDLIQHLGAAAAQRFFPERAPGLPPAPDATVRRGPRAGSRRVAGALRRGLGFDASAIGSSAWVVGGAHSASGRPMVAADHHLPASVPAWLHLDHIRGGELDVAGSTLPGVPVFWSGHNQRVAWGSVSAGAVVTDLYIETLSARNPPRYHDGNRWRELSERVEVIEVRGGEDLSVRVRHTSHGPLLPEAEGREPLSVAWAGARVEGASGIRSLLGVARAADAAALLAALRSHPEPVLTVAYADADGTAGTQVAGWIPRRSLSPQLLPLPGRAPWYVWNERVPFSELPAARIDDRRGWLVAADASLDSEGRAAIDWLWRTGARNSRIEQLLAERVAAGPLDLRGMSELQADVRTVHASRVVEAVRSLARDDEGESLGPQERELVSLLAEWDGDATANSQGAAAYHVLLARLANALLADGMGPELWRRYLGLPQTDAESLLADLLVDVASELRRGSQRAEPVRATVREALREAWLELSYRLGPNVQRWTWGRLHQLRFRSFDALRVGFELGPFPYGGGLHTVRAAAFDPLDPFEVRVASTVRLAFAADSLDQGLAALAPGQSEHPEQRHFSDQLPGWLSGRATLLATSPLLVEETSVARLELEPVR